MFKSIALSSEPQNKATKRILHEATMLRKYLNKTEV